MGISTQLATKADTEAQKLLAQSEETLEKAQSFKVDYRAFQEHMAAVPELGMAGSLIFKLGNRFYLTNTGVFFIYDSQMECVSDGTNYLAVIAPRTIQWERKSIQPDFNKNLVRFLLLGGATPIVASQLATSQIGNNAGTKPPPFLTNQFSASDEHFVGDETIEGKALKHIQLSFNNGAGEPAKMELWLDANTMLPVKRTTHDKQAGDVFETYTFELNPSISSDTFATSRLIQNRKLETVIQQMETPDALFFKACREGNIKLAAESIAKGANVNAKTSIMDGPSSWTGLMFAAQGGNLDFIKLLVEHGAEVNAGGLGGTTPLQLACMNGKIEAIYYLIQHGVTLTNATASLCWVSWNGYSNIVTLLVEKGVPVDESAGELGTPLQRAFQGGFLNIAAFLIKHGANINEAERGEPLLCSAVRFGSLETVKFLLDAGAKPNERDSYGVTPLMYAASGNHADAAKLLLEHGADPQLKNSRGQTAMDLVSHHLPNNEIVALFKQMGLIKPVQQNGQKP